MKSSYVLLTAILVVIGALLGYAVGRGGALQTSLTTNPKTAAPSSNSIFTSQTAFIQGKITKVSGKTLTVQNTTNNQSSDFEASDRVFINKFTNSPTPASPSSDLKTIEVGTAALVNLQLTNGKYQVVSVSILPPAPPFAPPPPGTSAPPPPGLVPSPAK